MTPAEEADALALLRALCEWAGRPQDDRVSDVEWMIELHSSKFFVGDRFYVCGFGILAPPYCDTLLGEVLRRLRKEGWYVETLATQQCDVTLWAPVSHDGSIYYEGTDPDHIILAAGRAMRDAGIISTETKT